MTPEALSRLSTLLDQALDLDEGTREAWLAALPEDSAELAPMLRKLLARQASKETHDLLARPLLLEVPADSDSGTTAFQPDDTVGPYRLLCSLGHGGMGEVWQAERADGTLKRKVALKLPHVSWAPGLAERFAREREILASLEHPNIARLYDAGFTPQGRPYMALEFVEGLPIDEYCKRRALPVEGRLRLLLQVADAVAFAHSRLVIHRDLKPGNILVTKDGNVRLLDFGIAKLMEGNAAKETALTRIGGRALTLDYASPGADPRRADRYRQRCLYARCRRLRAARRRATIPAQAAECSGAGGSDHECRGAACKRDGRRIGAQEETRRRSRCDSQQGAEEGSRGPLPTVDALAQDWRWHLEGHAVFARPDTLVYRLNRLLQRHRLPVAAAAITVAAFALALGAGATALVIFALLIGMGVALWQARRAHGQARIARNEAKVSFAVQEFIQGVFRASSGDQHDPIKARQRTAKELLDEGAERIENELDDAPQAKLRVLKTLADMYDDMAQFDAAIGLQARRAQLAALVDGPDSSTRLHALSDQAGELATAERLQEAATVLEQAAAIQARGDHGHESLIAFYLAHAKYANRVGPRRVSRPIGAGGDVIAPRSAVVTARVWAGPAGRQPDHGRTHRRGVTTTAGGGRARCPPGEPVHKHDVRHLHPHRRRLLAAGAPSRRRGVSSGPRCCVALPRWRERGPPDCPR